MSRLWIPRILMGHNKHGDHKQACEIGHRVSVVIMVINKKHQREFWSITSHESVALCTTLESEELRNNRVGRTIFCAF